MDPSPTHQVFISYSHDGEAHREWVVEFAARLRQDGIDAWIDRYEVAPALGWPRWTAQQIDAARIVLLVCTDSYKRHFDGQETVGQGKGVAWEGQHIVQILYEGGMRNEKFIAVLPPGTTEMAVPRALAGFSRYHHPGEYDGLCRQIFGEPAIRPPPLGRRLETVTPRSPGFSVEPELAPPPAPAGFPRLRPFPGPQGQVFPVNQERAELDILGERDGDVLRLRFCVHNDAALVHSRDAHGLPALLQRVRERGPALDGAASLAIGQGLATLLFGRPGEAAYHRLFRRLFHQPEDLAQRTGPSRRPVRCRLHFTDPELCALPWSLLAEDGHWLADDGWLFELAAIDVARNHVHLHVQAPCATLVIVPDIGKTASFNPAQHRDDLAALLAGLWRPTVDPHLLGQYILVASTWPKVQELARRAEVVYVCTRASDQGGRWTLRLDRARGGQEEVRLDEFLRTLQSPAKVVYLNIAGPRVGAVMPALRGLAGSPCVIAPWTAELGPDAEAGGRQWLAALLGEGHDPVAALHVVTREQSTARAGTMQALTRYRGWTTTPAPTERYTGRARLHVDRRNQRLRFWDILQSLARHNTRRVEAVVAFGEPAHGIDALPDLLDQHVEDVCDREAQASIHVTRDRLLLPYPRHDLESSLHDAVCSALNIPLGGTLAGALTIRFASIPADRGTRKILWIDWGVVDPDQPLQRGELLAWLRYHTRTLGAQCPKDGRIVATLCIAASAAGCKKLGDFLERGIPEDAARTATASHAVLPELHLVHRSDLVDYLENHSSCPATRIGAVADALMHATGGNFEALTVRIEAVEHHEQTWDQLAGSRAPEMATSIDDEEFR